MIDTASRVRAVPLGMRSRAQRQLLRSVIEELAQQLAGRESYGRVVRVVHTTAPTVLAIGADGDLARRRLVKACRARLEGQPVLAGRQAAA